MIKKILPAMIGAALAAGMPTAVADITVFGHIDTSVDYVDQDGGFDATNLNCTTCSIGFKGSEDLGNGLKAIFKIDFQYDTTERNNGKINQRRQSHSAVTAVNTSQTKVVGDVNTGATKISRKSVVNGVSTKSDTFTAVTNVSSTDSIIDRDQWLGLSGGFGKVRFGTISTLYKSHGAMLDPYYRTAQQQRDRGLQSDLHRGAGERGQGRAEDTIRYDSPGYWGGFQVGAHYTIQTDNGNSTDNPFGVGGSYKNGPFLVFADYITSDEGGDDSAYKLGGKFDWGMFSFLGQYEFDDGLISARGANQVRGEGKGDGADTWMLGATAKMGNVMGYFGYGHGADGSSGSIASKYDVWQLVASYNFSKRSMLYGGVSMIDCDNGDNNVCSAVKTHSGGDDQKISFGMKHKF